MCLRIVSEIKKKVDWLRQNSFADKRFVSILKLSSHFLKYPTHDILRLLIITCWKHCYKFQSTALVENVTLVGVDVIPSVGVQNLGQTQLPRSRQIDFFRQVNHVIRKFVFRINVHG